MSASLADLVVRLTHALAGPGAPVVRATGLRGSASALALARVYAARPRPVLVLAADLGAAEAFVAPESPR